MDERKGTAKRRSKVSVGGQGLRDAAARPRVLEKPGRLMAQCRRIVAAGAAAADAGASAAGPMQVSAGGARWQAPPTQPLEDSANSGPSHTTAGAATWRQRALTACGVSGRIPPRERRRPLLLRDSCSQRALPLLGKVSRALLNGWATEHRLHAQDPGG